jgi:hypothetical protein
MTNHELVARYEAVHKSANKLVDWFVKNGMGHMKPSDMRLMSDKPKRVSIYLDLLSEASDLKAEAQKRYGPGLIFVRDLIR